MVESSAAGHDFFAGAGVAGATARGVDWAATPLGPVESWPASLKTAVGTLLHSRHPMFLWWGAALVQFYNDGYLPSFGKGKHPAAMGQRGADCWQEIWPIIWPQIDEVMTRGLASWNEDQLVPIFRNDRIEEVYWTYGFSPVFEEDGRVGGTLVVCTETTARVLAERRLRTLRWLADATALATDSDGVLEAAAQELAISPRDAPFVFFYQPDATTGAPVLVAHRVSQGRALEELDTAVRLAATKHPGGGVASLHPETEVLRHGLWPEVVRDVFLTWPDPARRGAFLAFGLSPQLPFDAPYRTYFDQIAEHLQLAQARVQSSRMQALAESERRNLLLQAPVATALMTGPEHLFEVANPLYCQMVGRKELVGKTYLQAFPELKGTPTPGILDRVYQTGIPFVSNEDLIPLDRHGNGVVEDCWFKFNLEPMRDASGSVYGMMAVAVDITEQVRARHRAEALAGRLRESEERVRRVVEASGTGMWEIEIATQQVTADARFRHLFGFSADEPLTLKKCISVIHPDDVPRVTEVVTEAVAGKNGGRYIDEYRVYPVQGERLQWVESRGQLSFGADGTAVRLHGTVLETTVRKAAEAQVQQRAAFEQQLIGMVSHDLRDPLNAIRLSTDLLAQTESLDDRAARYVRRIRSSADRASRLIRDLLDFTQARLGGGIHLQPGPMDLQEVMLGVLDEVEAAHPGREVVVKHQGDERGEWDSDRIAQVVQNLVVNALKFSTPGSLVQIVTWTEPGWVFLSVHNDGAPIAAEMLQRIFEPLQRGVTEADIATRSIGLGLYIVKHIVNAHRGSIEVKSSSREGTTFTVRLPRA